MIIARLAFITAAVTASGAAESAAPAPEVTPTAEGGDLALPDFIDPVASDIRFGYCANLGSYRRSQDTGSGTDGGFIEQGIRASYVRALNGYERALSGHVEWRAEVGVLAGRADLENPNGSTGTLRTLVLDIGVGPTWLVAGRGSGRLELEIAPFVGMGRSLYDNDYRSHGNGVDGSTSISADGRCLEYGLTLNLLWYWANGWGAGLEAGFVQRMERLEGDSTTRWDTGSVNHSDYASDDTLTGARFGLSAAKRF